MSVVRAVPRPLFVILVLMFAVLLAAPLVGASKGGNSATAHACQKGGWITLATAELPSAAFASQGACVAYGARGGAPVAVRLAPVAHMEWGPAGGAGQGVQCTIRGWLVGDSTGIASVAMEALFDLQAEDGTTVTAPVPLTLTPAAFDAVTAEAYSYLLGSTDRVTAIATYTDGSVRALQTSFEPVACGGVAP